MARKASNGQLDLFSASRTTSYRNSHPTVTRRLKSMGRGDKQITRTTDRIKHSGLRSKQQLHFNSNALKGRKLGGHYNARMVKRNYSLKKASSGRNGH